MLLGLNWLFEGTIEFFCSAMTCCSKPGKAKHPGCGPYRILMMSASGQCWWTKSPLITCCITFVNSEQYFTGVSSRYDGWKVRGSSENKSNLTMFVFLKREHGVHANGSSKHQGQVEAHVTLYTCVSTVSTCSLGAAWGASGSMPSKERDGNLAKKPSASFMYAIAPSPSWYQGGTCRVDLHHRDTVEIPTSARTSQAPPSTT